MSELLTNLNSIYTTKLQIKEVIGTNSDNFSEYPQLIEEAIASGAEGTSYITTNGVYDIATYAYVDVDVQGGGTAILGYADIVENGTTYASTYGFDGFSYVNVNVPVPPGYIIPSGTTYAVEPGATYCPTSEFVYISWPIPSGTAYITNNGTTDITGYQYAYVNVPTVVGYTLTSVSQTNCNNSDNVEHSFTDNGTYYTYVWNVDSTTGFTPYSSSDTLRFNGTGATIEDNFVYWQAPKPWEVWVEGNGDYSATSKIAFNPSGVMGESGLVFLDYNTRYTADIQITAKIDKAISWNGNEIEYNITVSNYSTIS